MHYPPPHPGAALVVRHRDFFKNAEYSLDSAEEGVTLGEHGGGKSVKDALRNNLGWLTEGGICFVLKRGII